MSPPQTGSFSHAPRPGASGAALAAQIGEGSRRALARGITLIESRRTADRPLAQALLAALAAPAQPTLRIGISGTPGAGKSTLIEALGLRRIAAGARVAVLAVDPSSALGGGAILGDKTRMPGLAREARAFIRPSPSAGTLGGVARRTRETIALVEAAGYDTVIVETVGVGQSESAVSRMTDIFVLVLAPGAGDELQGIKRGVVELADLLVVNKADGDLAPAAARLAAEYRNALRLLRPRTPGWQVPVLACSALEGDGIDALWELIARYQQVAAAAGGFAHRREQQAVQTLWEECAEGLLEALRADPRVRQRAAEIEQAVRSGERLPEAAAGELLEIFLASARSRPRRGNGR